MVQDESTFCLSELRYIDKHSIKQLRNKPKMLYIVNLYLINHIGGITNVDLIPSQTKDYKMGIILLFC